MIIVESAQKNGY